MTLSHSPSDGASVRSSTLQIAYALVHCLIKILFDGILGVWVVYNSNKNKRGIVGQSLNSEAQISNNLI